MDTRSVKAKAMILTFLLLMFNGAAMPQQYCPDPVHFSSTQSQGQQDPCNNPFVIETSDGGGDVTICPGAPGQYGTIVINDMCTGTVYTYTDLVVTHAPLHGDTNPYFAYSYRNNTQFATAYGHWTTVGFKFKLYTWWFDHGVAQFAS